VYISAIKINRYCVLVNREKIKIDIETSIIVYS